jgi:uncharacterized protein (UPF0335 family)
MTQEVEMIDNVQEPIVTAPPDVRQVIEKVLQLEKEKLYLRTPRNINEDVLKIVKDVVQ